MLKFQLLIPTTCPHCHTRLFYYESRDMCCFGAKVLLLRVPPPHELFKIFLDQSSES